MYINMLFDIYDIIIIISITAQLVADLVKIERKLFMQELIMVFFMPLMLQMVKSYGDTFHQTF